MVNSMASSANSRRLITTVLLLLLVAAVGLAVYSLIDSSVKGTKDRNSQSLLNEMQSEVYDLMIHAQEASLGDEESIAVLPSLKAQINGIQGRFNGSETELDTSERSLLDDQISVINESIDAISNQEENVVFLNDQLGILEQSIPQVQQAYTTVVDTMLRAGVPSDQVAEAQAQVWRAERLLTSLNRILIGTSDPVAAAEQFRQDVLVFNQVLIGMKEGNLILGISRVESPDTRLLLEQVETQFLSLNESIQSFIDASPSLGAVSESGENILAAAANLLQTTGTLSDQVALLPDDLNKRPFSTQTAIFASIAAVFALFALGLLIFMNTRTSLRDTEETNEANQEAILRLLDEIADLGEGDLRVKATVTEDFTGAIADSINYAVEQLRGLVSDVASTAESVSASSNETRATSIRLSEASEHQARQVTEASTSINEISSNLSKVSEDAEELANVAQSSVTVARNGAEVVQNTIDGMNNIREQIQDTSKRIKRLGESSQEIGDIVSLINEIADQTNILALNASIQAAMAGEAGRGFAVVADEVQGLAERAASSTKQIETLVKTIQSDTNEAVASMEQTTAEVVRGAQLANDAGSALNEIQSTSENLATLILAIATETQDQSTNANRVVGTMNVIQDISAETLEGTTASANAVGELAEQAQALRESIADFKLPDGDQAIAEESIVDSMDAASDMDDFLVSDEAEVSDESVADSDSELINDLTAEAEEVEQLLDEDFVETDEEPFGSDMDADDEVDHAFSDSQDETEEADDFGKGFDSDADDLAEDDSEFGEIAASDEDEYEADVLEDSSEEHDLNETDGDFDESVFADLDLDDEESEPAQENEATEASAEDDEDEDFSFSDEDFLTFDLDEDDDTKA